MTQDDIENRVNHIIRVLTPELGEHGKLREVLDPLVDALARSEHKSFKEIRSKIGQKPELVKLDLVEDAAERLAKAEALAGGTPYEDHQLLGKIYNAIEKEAVDVARTERGSDRGKH